MAKLFNRAKMTTTTTGSGTITLGSASNGFQSFADAGVANGDVVQYVIEEGANFEIGTGTYSATGTTLTRSPSESSNSDNAITLAGQATVSITAVADDLNRLQHNGTDKVTVSSTGASVTGNLAVSGTVDGVDVSARDAVLTSTTTTANAALPKAGGTVTGDITLDNSSDLVFSDNDGTFPTQAGKFVWDLNNDEASIYANQPASDHIEFVFKLKDNTNTVDRYKFWMDDYRGSSYDRYPLYMHGQATYIQSGDNGSGDIGLSTARLTIPATGDISVSGNLAVTGTVDGRDVATDGTKLDGIATNANNYSLPLSSSSTRGGVKVGYAENGKNYPVELSSEKMFVNVPWTNTTYSLANSTALGLVKVGYTENGKNYPVELSNGQMFVNVPWTDTNTNTNQLTTFVVQDGDSTNVTMGQGKYLKFKEGGAIDVNFTDTNGGTSGDPYDLTISHADTSSQGSVNNSNGTVIQDVTLDGYGHVTGLGSVNLDSRYVNKSGDTMSGSLTVNATASADKFTQLTNGVPRNNLGSPTVTEMALFDPQFNNKTEFFPIANLKFYTSTDGSTWTEYTSFSDTDKEKFLHGDDNSNIIIPNATPYFRIEITNDGNYVFLNALYMYWSSQSHNTTVKIRKQRGDGVWSQHTSSTATVGSWPGHLYLPFSTIAFHPSTTSTGHYRTVHFDFEPNWSTGSYSDRNIALYRMQVWGGYPAGRRNVFHTDKDHNVRFPNNLFVNNSTSDKVFSDSYHPNADTWTTGRTIALTGDVTGTSVAFNGSSNLSLSTNIASNVVGASELNVSGNGSSSQFLRSDGDGSFTWATPTDTNTTYSQATSSTLGLVKIGYSENGKNYPVELSSGKMFVNVPWTDTNTNTNQLTTFQLEDGDGTEVTISHGKEVKFVEGGGIDINWTDTSTGSDGDPYDLTFTVSESGHYHNRNRIYDNRANGDVSPDGLPDKMAYFTFTDDLPNTGNTWDSVINMKGWSDGYRAWQLASNSGNGDGNTGLYFRSGEDSSWGTMERVFTDAYHPNADKWTTARTLSLSGDASGSVSWDGSANATLSVTVADNSHSHSNYITDTGGDTRTGNLMMYGTDTSGSYASAPIELREVNSVTTNQSAYAYAPAISWHWGGRKQAQMRLHSDGHLYVDGSNYGQAKVWTAGNDGSGSGLDADLLDGYHESTFMRRSANSSLDMNNNVITDVNRVQTQGSNAEVKYSVWSGSTYGIGMQSGVSYGALNDYAMTFCMNNDTDRGFWWGYSGQTKSTGAMSLTTNGRLTVSNYVSSPNMYIDSAIYHNGDTNTYMQFHAADQWRVVVGGTERLEVKNSSPHVLVTGDLNSTSDARLKENVEPIANALSDITQLEGVSFDWKDTGTRGHGFIAQQVEPILPDVVQTDDETGIKSINYVGMIGHLVEAIKEQQAQIDALTAQVEELKRQ